MSDLNMLAAAALFTNEPVREKSYYFSWLAT